MKNNIVHFISNITLKKENYKNTTSLMMIMLCLKCLFDSNDDQCNRLCG